MNSGRQNQKENFKFPGVVDGLQNLWGSVGSACITEMESGHFQNFRGNNIWINAALEEKPPSNKRRIHFTQILINAIAFIRWNTVLSFLMKKEFKFYHLTLQLQFVGKIPIFSNFNGNFSHFHRFFKFL